MFVLADTHSIDNSLQQHAAVGIMTNSAGKQFYCGLSTMGGFGIYSVLSHKQFLNDAVIQKKDQLKKKGRGFFVIFLVFWLHYAAHTKATKFLTFSPQ